MNINKLFLCEDPHIVIQGEGNFTGHKMLVFRVAGCDIKCKDCDTKYSWYTKKDVWEIPESLQYSIPEIKEYWKNNIKNKKINWIMITGGAPSLYQDILFELIDTDFWQGINFQIEDAGRHSWEKFKSIENCHFSFSPKIASLQGQTHIPIWEALRLNNLPKNWICKIVVDTNNWENDFEAIKKFQTEYQINNEKIWIMPFGTTRNEMLRQSHFLIQKCIDKGYNFSPRLHVLIYDDQRMV